jgi:hypothetical protein
MAKVRALNTSKASLHVEGSVLQASHLKQTFVRFQTHWHVVHIGIILNLMV